MANQTTTAAQSSAMPTDFDAGAAMKFSQQLFHAGAHAHARGVERMLQMGQEYLSFVSRRLEREREFIEELADVENPGETIGFWNAFIEKAQKEYTEEWQRMLGLWTDGARETPADMHRQFEDTVGAALKTDTKETATGKA